MPVLVQFDFPFPGPFGSELEPMVRDLAHSIAQEPGLLWKIWTENSVTHEAGGIYLFADAESARAYVQKHTARLGQLGCEGARAKVFDVNLPLTKITRGPGA